MMMKQHIDELRILRDSLVDDRRTLVSSMAAEPHTANETAMEFVNLQQLIDTVERAIGHEQSLDRPPGSWPPKPKAMPRPS